MQTGFSQYTHGEHLERYVRVSRLMPLMEWEAHFDLVLEANAAGRAELIRLHRTGQIDDRVLHELERDLDFEELASLSAKAT